MYEIEKIRDFVQHSGLFTEASGVIGELALKVAAVEVPELYLATALACNALQTNHVCCSLKSHSHKVLSSEDGKRSLTLPEYNHWRQILSQAELSSAITVLDENSTDLCRSLLVLDRDGGCYLQRQWSYECSIVQCLLERAKCKLPMPELEENALSDLCKFFLPHTEHPAIDYQQLAVTAAMRQKLLVLSGGPGTGKTTVAAAILAMKLRYNPALRIRLAAPTAKAAVTLTEALHSNAAALNIDRSITDKLCGLNASTIHRLLGFKSNSHEFRHNRTNPLDCDLLLVDECSMVDQSQMARLLEALPDAAEVILLGDRFQLASVEAGSVFADICLAAAPNCGDKSLAETFKKATNWDIPVIDEKTFLQAPLSGALVELQENHRFAKSSVKLGQVAELIRSLPAEGDFAQYAQKIHALQAAEFEFADLKDGQLEKLLRNRINEVRLNSGESFADIVTLANSAEDEDLAKAFQLLDSLILLAPGYDGKGGLDHLNKLMLELLDLNSEHACGVPLMIRRNDYRSGLFNGDIGLIARASDGTTRAFFPDRDSENEKFRSFEIVDLPDHQMVFAMSVHKSQGSGFGEVIFVMPEKCSKLMNREMVYTAMTRARKKLTVIGSTTVMAESLANQTLRMSNLTAKLCGLEQK